jgi:hypothetical protein
MTGGSSLRKRRREYPALPDMTDRVRCRLTQRVAGRAG